MTCDVWSHAVELGDYIQSRLALSGQLLPIDDTEYSWHNVLYTSDQYRRAHVEIVDHRASHKIYILHCTIFPHTNDSSPIWGFDIVCGPTKITGAFHDFSSVSNNINAMSTWFADTVKSQQWSKPRDLPRWAKAIFSRSIVAAGNVSTEEEIVAVCNLAKHTLNFYLDNVGLGKSATGDYRAGQNRYCHYQKQNPHVVRSMVSMGIPEETINHFVNKILFPEID